MCLHLTFEALVIAGCHDVYNEHNNLKLKRMKGKKMKEVRKFEIQYFELERKHEEKK